MTKSNFLRINPDHIPPGAYDIEEYHISNLLYTLEKLRSVDTAKLNQADAKAIDDANGAIFIACNTLSTVISQVLEIEAV